MLTMGMYPGGAMMFYESMAEFDPNVKWPVDTALLSESADGDSGDDPVEKVVGKLGPFYEETVKPLLDMPYDCDDTQDAVYKLQMIRSAFSATVQKLRKTMYKSFAYHQMNEPDAAITNTDFASHLGIHMKNTVRYTENGMTTYSYTYSTHRAFRGGYEISRFVGAATSTPEILDDMIGKETLIAMVGGESDLAKVFNGTVDMLQATLVDHYRRIRLEEPWTETSRLDNLFRTITASMDGRMDGRCESTFERDTFIAINRMMSMLLRKTSMETYDLMCDIMDNDFEPRVFMNTMRPMYYRLVNMFAIAVAYLMHLQYATRANTAMINACNAYDAELMAFNRSE